MNCPLPICLFPDCGRLAKSLGHCRTHYDYLRRGLPLMPIQRRGVLPKLEVSQCTYPDCPDKAIAKGKCWAHYMQQRRRGYLTPAVHRSTRLRKIS